MADSSLQTLQIFLISATGIPRPRWSLRDGTKTYVTVDEVLSNARCGSTLSAGNTTPEWREMLAPFHLSHSSLLRFKIYRRWPILFLGFNQLVATREISVAELIRMQRTSSDSVISLAMSANESTAVLNLSLELQDLTTSAARAQISTMTERNSNAAVEISRNRSNTFSLIAVRLGTLARIAQPFAQLHPISEGALTLVQKMVGALELRLDSDISLQEMTADVYRVLAFVESAELVPRLECLTPLIHETLRCVVDCIRYVCRRDTYGALDVSRINGLRDLQAELKALELRMFQALTLDVAHMTFRTERMTSSILNERLLAKLRPVAMPRTSGTHHRTTCFPGTRSNMHAKLIEWGALDATPNVLWLSGPAGTGKSTIATTLADTLEYLGYLGSFVFLNRDVMERAEPSALIRTIAHHLASHGDGPLTEAIVAAIKKDPYVAEMRLARQFEQLILEPVCAMSLPARPVVIIIDALDEGGHGDSQRDFLAVLREGLPKLPKHVRVLITSRRDGNIAKSLFNLPCVGEHDLTKESDIHDDIRTYITAQMKRIRLKHPQSLPSSWPGTHLINELVSHAAGLFIWAVFACRHIAEFDPKGRIVQVIENTIDQGGAESLDYLFEKAILGPSWQLPDSAMILKHVLTVIIMARNPLSSQSIADIIGTDVMVVLQSVSDLHSVLNVDEYGLIRIYHPSVRDYLTNVTRVKSAQWFIEVETGDSYLAVQCLSRLGQKLKYNPMKLDSAIDFKSGEYKRCFVWNAPHYDAPASIKYACTTWIEHVCSVRRSELLPTLQKHIAEFYSSHFLHWLEMLSLMECSRDAIRALGKLHSWCLGHKGTPAFDSELCDLVYDSWRFVNTFSQTIEAHPLLVYDTALPFLPKNTAIREILSRQHALGVPEILVGGLAGWDSCLYSMNRHKGIVRSLAMCPRRSDIASGSGDISVRVWNWETGVETLPSFGSNGLHDHTRDISSVQFAPDGASIFSGSLDATICCWDSATGVLKTRLVDPATPAVMHYAERHGTRIHSIAVLLDGNLIAAGRRDGRIAMWSLKESRREPEMDLVGHGGPVFSIHANNDRNILVSGSEDATVRLWDVVKRTARVYRGHTDSVTSVALSSDMSRITSGSADHTVRVWTTNSEVGECSILHGHTDDVWAVAFSLDGEYIASAGKDCKICLWTTSGNKLFQQFTSHTGPIYSLLFCDPTRLVSGAHNGEVRVWKVSETQTVEDEMLAFHTNFVTAVAISNGGSLLASASADSTAIIWNAQTGHPTFPSLRIHSAAINCIAFSSDDNIVASGSNDRTVRLLDTNTGNVVGPVVHFSCEVLFLAFFEHSTLAIGLADDTIVLWDTLAHTQTLRLTCTPHGHLCALAVSTRLGKVGCMYSRPHGTRGLMLWDATTGEVLLQQDFPLRADTADSIHLEGAHIAFSDDDLHVNMRYHYSEDGCIETHAFDLTTGLEAPAIAERTRRLYAQNAEIYQKDTIIMPLPRDFRTTDIVRCWEVSGGVIMVGMNSGRVYAIDLSHAEV
ncbi:hypothetical protein C8F04DRAFT_1086376 [Mycena alexandri]|uniref:NACHT domain-containing protein n=1 Tax=Mycena alexandri TaxID=1745969 RepID=A0AAD6T5M9_9AGAR|nr:hypothetical protein C8F04DRAFT_1086376 [Mycena alexandri]